MIDPVMKELLHNIAASKAITQAAIEQGVLIGRREMKPLIRELLNVLNQFVTEDADTRRRAVAVFARAMEALDDPPHSGREAAEL